MKQFDFHYKDLKVVTEETIKYPPLLFLRVVGEDMWDAIEKVKETYPNYKDIFDLSSINFIA